MRSPRLLPVTHLLLLLLLPSIGFGGQRDRRRVLLIGQSPDNHAVATHEYMPAAALLSTLLARVDGVQPVVVRADGRWEGGPDLVDSADAVFLFVSEGARWVSEDQRRLAAFRRLAKRQGGLACWHWGMGTRTAAPIDAFVDLFGGCHGGPDRRHKVMTVDVTLANPGHPVLHGLQPFGVREEFYYALKFGSNPNRIQPLLTIDFEGGLHPVCWAWDRADGGRSFGFSGGHFHEHWQREAYRRLAVQGILWTARVPLPDELNLDVDEALLRLPPRRPRDR